MTRKLFMAVIGGVTLMGGTVVAQPSPALAKDGWVMVTPADLTGTPDLAMRKKDGFNLKTSGDFDGDRRADQVSIQKNDRLKQYGVFVCLARAGKAPCTDTMVTSGPVAHLSNLGVDAVAATTPQCRMLAVRGNPACIEVFAFEASSALYRWNGSKFVRSQVTD